MRHPCYKLRWSEQIYLLLLAIHSFSLILCCSNDYNLFYWQTFSLSRIYLSGMPMSGYKQNDNSQMFLLSVFLFAIRIYPVFICFQHWPSPPSFPWFSIYFLNIPSETFPTLQAKYPSVQKVCSFQLYHLIFVLTSAISFYTCIRK